MILERTNVRLIALKKGNDCQHLIYNETKCIIIDGKKIGSKMLINISLNVEKILP